MNAEMQSMQVKRNVLSRFNSNDGPEVSITMWKKQLKTTSEPFVTTKKWWSVCNQAWKSSASRFIYECVKKLNLHFSISHQMAHELNFPYYHSLQLQFNTSLNVWLVYDENTAQVNIGCYKDEIICTIK